ncbi:MAG: DNA-directed RNA polymerase subunit alpha [Planctomycetota bacterium]|nr:MAG: DNA-directed RNA polymerase subunit alpha [Planctomycetota bacterium]
MRVRWRDFELPTRVVVDEASLTSTYGMFITEPFERGFGTTAGNALRRVLLSSLEGCAVTSIKIEGILHEFTALDYVYEDVTDVVLSIKDLLVRLKTGKPTTLRIETDRKGDITAGDIIHDESVEVLNTDMHICTVTEPHEFIMEMVVERGRGYVTAEENKQNISEVGVIPVASIFSPVQRVRFRTEDTRVGMFTNYDKLILEIWTNGILTPDNALVEAAKILRKHLNPFVHYYEIGRELQQAEIKEDEAARGARERAELQRKLDQSIAILDLSVRSSNCLRASNMTQVRELVSKSEHDMLRIRNFGKTSLREIKKKLTDIGLSLGMPKELLEQEPVEEKAQ